MFKIITGNKKEQLKHLIPGDFFYSKESEVLCMVLSENVLCETCNNTECVKNSGDCSYVPFVEFKGEPIVNCCEDDISVQTRNFNLVQSG